MRKILGTITAITVIFMFVFPEEASSRAEENLFNMFEKKKEVKVYISDITDSTEEAPEIVPALIREALEAALETRLTIYFKLVGTEEADIIIACNVVELFFTTESAVPMVSSILPEKSHGRLRAVFTVTSGGNGEVLWQREIGATVKTKKIDQEEILSLLGDRIVTVFMRECFNKPNRKREYGLQCQWS